MSAPPIPPRRNPGGAPPPGPPGGGHGGGGGPPPPGPPIAAGPGPIGPIGFFPYPTPFVNGWAGQPFSADAYLALQQTLVAAQQEINTLKAPVDHKTLVKAPEDFNGDRSKYWNFRNKAVDYVRKQHSRRDKIEVFGSHMIEAADVWHRHWVQDNQAAVEADGPTLFADYLAAMEVAFSDPDYEKKAWELAQKLGLRANETAYDFFTRLGLQIQESRVDITNEVAAGLLIKHLEVRLPNNLVTAANAAYRRNRPMRAQPRK